jgi:hypothetical protein
VDSKLNYIRDAVKKMVRTFTVRLHKTMFLKYASDYNRNQDEEINEIPPITYNNDDPKPVIGMVVCDFASPEAEAEFRKTYISPVFDMTHRTVSNEVKEARKRKRIFKRVSKPEIMQPSREDLDELINDPEFREREANTTVTVTRIGDDGKLDIGNHFRRRSGIKLKW